MVGIKLIGGLGNQLFAISFIISYAKKYNLNYFVTTKVIAPHIKGKQDAYRFPGVNYLPDPPELQIVKEEGFKYKEIPPMDNVCFDGYFQSWRYSQEYRDDVLKALSLPYKKNDKTVSIHLRYGDYVNFPNHHPIVSDEYIDKAIKFFKGRGYFKFKVFSDEMSRAKDALAGKKIDAEYSDGQDEIKDLIDASGCSHNIGSNSTYSFWIHWLNQNKNKIGVFPKRWFGDALNHDISDLLPANTIML